MTDYKKLCAELIDAWDSLPWQYDWKGNLTGLDDYPPDDSAVERARAALAEPEPEGPKDSDLHALAFRFAQPCFDFDYIPFARAVLARWGK